MQQDTAYKQYTKRGFTFIEILLSMAAVGIIAGVSLPLYQSFQVRNDLDIATVEIVHSFRRAHILATAVDGDSSWGVYVHSGSITLFKGPNYAARDAGFDEVFEVPASIVPSGISEVVFARFTGVPQTTGTITLTSTTNELRTITINAKGMVNY